jgi:hypothetical protein
VLLIYLILRIPHSILICVLVGCVFVSMGDPLELYVVRKSRPLVIHMDDGASIVVPGSGISYCVAYTMSSYNIMIVFIIDSVATRGALVKVGWHVPSRAGWAFHSSSTKAPALPEPIVKQPASAPVSATPPKVATSTLPTDPGEPLHDDVKKV